MLAADSFAMFRKLQAQACRQRTAPPAVMAATEEELLREENLSRMARGMPPVDLPSQDWRYLLPESQATRLAVYEQQAATQVTASVVDLSVSLEYGRCCECVPTLRRSTVKPPWLFRQKRWLLHSEMAAMMGFPVTDLLSQAAGVPTDIVTTAGPPTAVGNAMHVACVGVAIACALSSSRSTL